MKNCFSFLWSEEIVVIGYDLVSFLHNFVENISVLKNAMFYIIMYIYINMIFLIDWQWIWFQNYFEDIKARKSSSMSIWMKIRKILLFSKSFSVSISFTISIQNHQRNPNKEKTHTLFVNSCNIFPVIYLIEHSTLILIVT